MSDMMPDREKVIAGLSALIGISHVITDDVTMAPYLTDWRKRYTGRALCVVRPASTDDVIAVMRFAKEHHCAVVPQGGNTGLVGGSVPLGRGDEILLSFQRMNHIRSLDPDSDTVIVEAGATLAALQEKAEEVGRLFPLSLASEGTATVGGTIATNAGGTAALVYGTMRDLVLGLEIVLPDGTLLNTLTTLRKDNTGYHLASLFMGAEGTLGVITAASLKLFPLPRARSAAFCGLKSPSDAFKLFKHLKHRAGPSLTTFELMPRFAIDIALKHIPGLRDPLSEPHEWYVMPEFSSFVSDDAQEIAATLLGEALDADIVSDAVISESIAQRESFWAIRENIPEAQLREGPSIKHDISVPLADIPEFIDVVCAELSTVLPGIRPCVFGHVGDGNLHFNLQAPVGMDEKTYTTHAERIHAIVYRHVGTMKGSVSAEHGIGQVKRSQLAATKDTQALDMMRKIKAVIDPEGRMNPGKVL